MVFQAGFSIAVASLILISQAAAQSFPSKPIRFIVGFPTGGATDQVTRAITPKMSESLGQPVVVENIGGASGLIANQMVVRAAPDGHTILLDATAGHLIRPYLVKDTPSEALTPISNLVDPVLAIAANAATGPRSLADMVEQARRNPGKLAYGTSGLGSQTHLLMETIGQQIKGPMQVVPYKGGGPAVNDLLGGQIPLVIQPVVSFLQHAKAGKIRILVVLVPKRWDVLPEVPTLNEVIPNFTKPAGGSGVWGPPKLPAAIAQRLQSAMATALNDTAISESLISQGQIPVASTPAEFAEDLRRGSIQFGEMVKAAGLKAE